MLENDTEDASTLNYEQDQLSSKYIERFTNPLLNTGVSATSRNNSLNGELEIKKEKIDKDLVRIGALFCFIFYDLFYGINLLCL